MPRHFQWGAGWGVWGGGGGGRVVVNIVLLLSVRPSIRLSVRFSFPANLSKHQWIFTKLGMCTDIVEIWFGIANGQMLSNFYRVIYRDMPIFSFPDDNLSKQTSMDFHQTWYVHCYCGDLVWDSWWANFVKFWQSYLPGTCPYFPLLDDNLSKCQEILTKLGTCIDMKEIWFWIGLTELSARNTIIAGYYSLMFLFSDCGAYIFNGDNYQYVDMIEKKCLIWRYDTVWSDMSVRIC